MSLVRTVFMGLVDYQEITPTIEESIEYIRNEYPEDLEVSIWNGKVATNHNLATFFEVPESWEKSDEYIYLLMINTKLSYSQEDFEGFRTYMWLTEDALYYMDDDEIKMQSLAGVKYFFINKEIINQYIEKYSSLVPFAAPLLLFIWFILHFISELFTLLYLFILSLVFYAVSSKRGSRLTSKQIYIMTIYASTLGVVMPLFIQLHSIFFFLQSVPFLFTILTVLIFSSNVLFTKQYKTSKVNTLKRK